VGKIIKVNFRSNETGSRSFEEFEKALRKYEKQRFRRQVLQMVLSAAVMALFIILVFHDYIGSKL
jgi:hypothetical protein